MIEEYAVTMLKFVEIKKRLSIETNYKGYFSLSNTNDPNAKDQNRLTKSWLVVFGLKRIFLLLNN